MSNSPVSENPAAESLRKSETWAIREKNALRVVMNGEPCDPAPQDLEAPQVLKFVQAVTQTAALAIGRGSEEQLRELLEALPVGVYTTDPEGTITMYNQAAVGFAGRQAEIGKDQWCVTHRLYRPDGSFLRHDECPMAVTLKTGEPQRGMEAIAERPDGTRAWFIPHPTLVRDASGAITGGINVLVDITARKQVEQALLQSEKLAAVGRLASSIAHEINNPLEAVTNLLYLARGSAINPETIQFLEEAQSELTRVSHITTETLRFHRGTSQPTVCDVENLMQSVLRLHEGRLRRAQVAVERQYRAHEDTVCRPGEIRQVLANLVGNAIDAMSRNTGERRLIVRIAPAGDARTNNPGVRVTVSDTGSGIGASAKRRLFEPFFTTKESTGTGLGLWVSAEIVRKHHGSMRFRSRQSDLRHGTTFSIFLPIEMQ